MRSMIFVLLAILTSSTFAHAASPEVGVGTAQYIKWNAPDAPGGVESSSVLGAVILSGDVAELMYKHMTNAQFKPGAPDLESRHPSFISRSDCPSKVGTHAICRKIPRMTENSLVRDSEGKVIYDAQCDIEVNDTSRGEFKTN